MLYVVAGAALLLVGFVWWRYTSVERGVAARDQALYERLAPLHARLEQGSELPPGEVAEVARAWQYRPLLYNMLKHFERLDLFPTELTAPSEQGAGLLAYWLMHPNELQDAPEALEVVVELSRTVDGEDATFFVYRYRMPPGHWAGDDWILGLAGPFAASDVAYSGRASGFSRAGDRFGDADPNALVDRFIDMAGRARG